MLELESEILTRIILSRRTAYILVSSNGTEIVNADATYRDWIDIQSLHSHLIHLFDYALGVCEMKR